MTQLQVYKLITLALDKHTSDTSKQVAMLKALANYLKEQ